MSNKGETIRKNLTYHTEHDRDIHEWLKELPPRSQSEFIRKAIKKYIKDSSIGNNDLEERVNQLEEITRKILLLLEDEKSSGAVTKTKNENSDFINATEILKNLGK